MIEVNGLTKAYGERQVLSDLTLSARPGEVVLLVGANGCGKSTTLRVLAGLSAPDAGRVLVGGHDLRTEPARALAGLSFLPQSPHFHHRLTVDQILTFYARLRGVPAGRIETVCRQWGLTAYRREITGRLSGGTRQRAAAAGGSTVLVATHLLGEWEGQADRCLVLARGQVEREVPAEHLREAFPFACPEAPLAQAS